jgi:hypothetical protein
MRTKTRLLLPAGVLAAALIGVACGPPTPPPPPPPAGCAAVPNSPAGPDSANPIAGTWGVNGVARATAVIGNRVYVGGTFTAAVSPTGVNVARTNLAAFCLANGALDTTFVANVNGPVNALTTDGTSLFVGGDFSTINGRAVKRLAKVNATNGAPVVGFAPRTIPGAIMDLDYAGGVVYAGGDFGKIGDPPVGLQTDVGNAAGFLASNGNWSGWSAGADKIVEAITVSGGKVFIGGNFASVKGNTLDRLAKLSAASPGAVDATFNAGVLTARARDLVSPDGSTLYVAMGPAVGGSGTGNRFMALNATGGQIWSNNNLQGNAESVELIGSTLFGGFLGGYAGGLPLQPGNYRLLGLNTANGQVTPFQPAVVAAAKPNGVFDSAQGSNRLVVVGDFTAIGTTGNLHGLAIFR